MHPVSREFFSADYLVIIYLLLTGGLIILFNKNLANWYKLLFGRMAGVVFVILLADFASKISIINFIHNWYPLITIAIFYWELSFLAQLIFSEVLDEKVIAWEEKIFNCQPSIKFSESFQNIFFSEFLHFSYLMYYFLLIILPVLFYFSENFVAFYFTIFAEVLVFYSCLICYIFFPIAGPRYIFVKNQSTISNGRIYHYTHKLLENNSSKGTAFPSSHVAMASIVFFCALKFNYLAAFLILPFWAGISIGVVYCRFHYALDAVFGLLLAMIIMGLLSLW